MDEIYTIPPDDINALDSKGRRIFASDGTDLSLIREFAKLSPVQRLERLQAMTDFIETIREQNKKK